MTTVDNVLLLQRTYPEISPAVGTKYISNVLEPHMSHKNLIKYVLVDRLF